MNENIKGLINSEESSAAHFCIETGLQYGAAQMRVSLSKSVLDSFSVRNGVIDKITHSADRSLFLYIFADGKYGTFSTNNFSQDNLKQFIIKAIETVKMLAPDPCRQLPLIHRTAKDAVTGQELALYDPRYQELSAEQKLDIALKASVFSSWSPDGQYSLISEECEYSDSVDDNYLIDSQGFTGRHTETSFAICSEVTIQDNDGNRLSGYDWISAPSYAGLGVPADSSVKAIEKAVRKISPKRHRGGKFRMVVDRNVSSRLFSPVISALNGTAIQQKNSFLDGTLGKKVFPEYLTVLDKARETGRPGARLYDTEGVATQEFPIIENGRISMYFINTYISGKTGMPPTVEGVSRPVIHPFMKDTCVSGEKAILLEDILKFCGSGIYITGFNGGNCNPTTGDFSYGIEGFAFRNGKITHPIKEMVVTGNMLGLWGGIIAAGSDSRDCTRWQIPTLAFEEADFSA